MEERSILRSIRSLLVGNSEDKSFDQELIFDINAAMSNLTQMGVGPKEGFIVIDENDEWDDLIDYNPLLEQVKGYVKLYVRMLFDPPTQASVVEIYNKEIAQREWRINITVDDQTGHPKEPEEDEKESCKRCYELLRCRCAGRHARSACCPLQLCCFHPDHQQARPHCLCLRTGTDPGCGCLLPARQQQAGCLTVSVIIHQHDRDASRSFFIRFRQ